MICQKSLTDSSLRFSLQLTSGMALPHANKVCLPGLGIFCAGTIQSQRYLTSSDINIVKYTCLTTCKLLHREQAYGSQLPCYDIGIGLFEVQGLASGPCYQDLLSRSNGQYFVSIEVSTFQDMDGLSWFYNLQQTRSILGKQVDAAQRQK